MNGFVLVIIGLGVLLACAVAALARSERQVRRMALFLDQREPADNARLTIDVRSRGMLDLARAINNQLDAQQSERAASLQSRRAFQAGLTCLSHDIRTPLAGAQGYLQLAEDAGSAAEQARYLDAASRRLGDVRQLLDDLFAFAQVQDPSFAVACEPVCACDVLGEVLAGFYPQFRQRAWQPSVSFANENAQVNADADALACIFRNLVGNALRHGVAAPSIEQQGATFTFSNRVDNPATLDASRLFDRFYQGDGARSSGGAGLGLAIVDQLVTLMGGRATAQVEGDILRVTVVLQQA